MSRIQKSVKLFITYFCLTHQ